MLKLHIPVVLFLFIFSNSETQTNEMLLMVPSLSSGVIPSLQRQSHLNHRQWAPNGECAWSVKRSSFQNQPTSLLSLPSQWGNFRIITFPMTRALYVGKRTVGVGVDSFFTTVAQLINLKAWIIRRRSSNPLKLLSVRYSVQVRADVLATVQFQTSNQTVMIRLSVLDQEREITSKTGEGHVTIPAFFFLTNNGEHPSALITKIVNFDNWMNSYSSRTLMVNT